MRRMLLTAFVFILFSCYLSAQGSIDFYKYNYAVIFCSGASQYSPGNVPLGAGTSGTSSDDNIATVSGSNPVTFLFMPQSVKSGKAAGNDQEIVVVFE